MYNLIYVFTSFVHAFLGALQFLMIVRAVLSWMPFDDEGESRLSVFVHIVTEPAILPVRWLLGIFVNTEELFIDLPFFVTMLLLMIIQSMLPTVVI